MLLDSVPEEERRALCWDLIRVREVIGEEITLRRHLKRTLARAGGPAALMGQTVWSYWYADTTLIECSVGDFFGAAGREGEEVMKHPSPVRGNWYEAVVTAVNAEDCVVQVCSERGLTWIDLPP